MKSDWWVLGEEPDTLVRIPESGEELLTRGEVAEMLHVSEETLASWTHSGKGPPLYGWAKTPFYRRAEVLAWAVGRETEDEDLPDGVQVLRSGS